jgi:hypothetical protein
VLAEDPALKVYEIKQGLTPELAAQLGKEPGESFHFVLNNTTVKDNRIPPRGYTVAAYNRPGMAPVGATYADGQYWDETIYSVPKSTMSVVATLYYQTSSKDYIDFLRTRGGVDGATLGALWDSLKSPPETVAQATTFDGSRYRMAGLDGELFELAPSAPTLIDVAVNEDYPAEEHLLVVAVATPSNGEAAIVENQIAYTPEPGFIGDVELVYTVRDTAGSESTWRLIVRISSTVYFPIITKE